MNLKEKISKVRDKYEAYQQKKSYAYNEREAKKLQDLRVKRLKAEGKAKLVSQASKERDRIRRANAAIAENSPIARATRAANRFSKNVGAVSRNVGKGYKKIGSVNRGALASTGNKNINSVDKGVLTGNVNKDFLSIKR